MLEKQYHTGILSTAKKPNTVAKHGDVYLQSKNKRWRWVNDKFDHNFGNQV